MEYENPSEATASVTSSLQCLTLPLWSVVEAQETCKYPDEKRSLSNPCLVAPALAAAAPAAVATNVLLTVSLTLPLWTTVTCQETARSPGGLQCLKKFHPKVRNHGEGPY